MADITNADKRKIVLDAALQVFLTYGYRRTTMADIAEAAHISRPALYLMFRNKQEIYVAKFEDMLDDTREKVRRSFDGTENFADGLLKAIDHVAIEPHRMVAQTPHGAELFDLKNEVAEGLAERWLGMFEAELTRALEREIAHGRMDLDAVGLDAPRFARLVMSSIEGIKMRMTTLEAAIADFEAMVRLVCRGLAHSGPGAT